MTRPVEEFEISALIDGQLEAERAAQVRSAIQADPVLRAEYESLRAADQAWTMAARSARFRPLVAIYRPVPVPTTWVAAAAFVLAAARLLLKTLPLELSAGFAAHGLILAVVIGAVVWISGGTGPAFDGPDARAATAG